MFQRWRSLISIFQRTFLLAQLTQPYHAMNESCTHSCVARYSRSKYPVYYCAIPTL